MDARSIEALYPVSPVQEDLLLTVRDRTGTEPPCGQAIFILRMKLDIPALERAWNRVIERHPILRTSFAWERIEKPHQVVHRRVMISFEQEDLSGQSAPDQEESLRNYLERERSRGFAPSQPPLMRFALVRVGEDSYRFILSYHHLLLDARSVAHLFEEAAAFYEAFRRGEDLSPARPHSFQQYINWLKQQDSSEATAYWQTALAGFTSPTLLELPKSRINATGRAERFQEERIALSARTAEALQTAAQTHQLSVSAIVQGAWALLLSLYSGKDEVVFGVTFSGRPKELDGAESIAGRFENSLPLRVRIPEKAPVIPWLTEIEAEQGQLERYQHNSLSQIRDWCDLPPNLALFESVLDLCALTREVPSTQIIETDGHPLTVKALPGPGLAFRVIYDSRRFDDADIRRELSHFQTLLEEIVSDPQRCITDLPLLTEGERHQLLIEWNDTFEDVSRGQNICELFEAQAEQRPDALAVVFEERQMTYGQLNLRANRLAHYLQSLGVGPEVRVCVCLDRSLELIVGLIAILKAGGVYVPLDPSYPIERLAFMLEDSQAPVLLTEERVLDELPNLWMHVVCLDADSEIVLQQPDHNPSSDIHPLNLAYIIYTSGSTGRPKGVCVPHSGLFNLASAQSLSLLLVPSRRVLQFASLGFDASIFEFIMALASGSCFCLAHKHDLLPGPELLSLLNLHSITNLTIPPSSLSALQTGDAPSLDTIVVAGEACTPELVERWAGGRSFYNAYGPTEATVWSTLSRCEEGEEVEIGRPIINTVVYVKGGGMREVPIGVAGEMYLGGAGIARGYVGRADQTAERFIPDDEGEEAGGRVYRTGDEVRRKEGGRIEFLGRVDQQVKVRGYRIELGEVESVLREEEGIEEAVVVVREGEGGERRLIGYVVKRKVGEGGEEEIRERVRERLPEYMVPAKIVRLDALPLTAHGKVDRRALPAPSKSRARLEEDFQPPRTPVEKILAGIWIDVLGIDRVGVHENFFQVGGDSILGVQIIARANQAGLKLSTKQLFLCPTIAELACAAGIGATMQAEQDEVTGAAPLTPIQRWFFEKDFFDPHHYNQAVMLEVQHDLAPSSLEAVIKQLLIHHDALRLRFVREGSSWRQFNAAFDGNVPFRCVDLSTVPETDHRGAIEEVATGMQASLDLCEGPLLRAALFNLGASRPGRLLIIIHHLAIDGISWRILLEDLQTACGQLSQGQSIELPPKTTSFKCWSEMLAERALSEELKRELPYWLDDSWSRAIYLPVDHFEGANLVDSSRTVSVSISLEETRSLLQEVPEVYHTEINDVLLTALVDAFGEWTGVRSVLIDLEGHGREDLFEQADISRTVGWFTSLFPVLLELRDGDGPGEALKSVKEQLRKIPNRGIGYGLLRYPDGDTDYGERLRSLPQAQISFNYIGQFDQVLSKSSAFDLASEVSGPARSSRSSRTHVIEINGSIVGRQLHVAWTYSENIHRRSTIEELARNYMESLRSLISHCQSPEAGGYTLSDVSQFGWDQEDLNRIVARISKNS